MNVYFQKYSGLLAPQVATATRGGARRTAEENDKYKLVIRHDVLHGKW